MQNVVDSCRMGMLYFFYKQQILPNETKVNRGKRFERIGRKAIGAKV